MIRTTIIPNSTKYTFNIPESYIGQEVEVIMFTLAECEDFETEVSIPKPSEEETNKSIGGLGNE